MEIGDLIRDLRKSANSKEEQAEYLSCLLESEKYLEEYIHKTSGECKELLDALSKCAEKTDPFDPTSETNAIQILNCITQIIELCLAKFGSLTIDDLHRKVPASLCSSILKKHFGTFLKRCLYLKQNTKAIAELQSYCVKFLRLCVKESKANLKQIAIEFNYFQDQRTWLDKYIHQNNSYNLRVEAVKFLLSFLNYANDIETQIIIRKIFLQQQALNVVQSLFSTLATNQFDLIEHVLEELLFKVVKNLKFTKSDKVRLFNERNLVQLMKLYNWNGEETLYEILTEFLKVLFCSTQYGISFYDRTLGIQLSTSPTTTQSKNLNHLIFNSIVSIQGITKPEQLSSFNALLLNVFKVCPDLIQRFYKYKYKQVQQQQQGIEDASTAATVAVATDNLLNLNWLIDFSVTLFEQQSSLIQKNYYLKRYLNETIYSSVEYVCELIIQTSVPLAIPLARLVSGKSATVSQRFKYIALLIKSLNCLNDWKVCLTTIKTSTNYGLNCAKFLEKNTNLILVTLNQQLFVNKYLPTLDLLNINDIVPNGETPSSSEIVQLIDLYSLYFDLILNTTANDDFAMQNMLQIEYINQKFLLNLTNLMLQNDDLTSTADSFMKFLLNFLKLKQLYDTNENFEVIVNELVYKLIRLLMKYGYNKSENALNNYIKFIEVSFMKLIQINERNEFNESLFQLWFVLFYKYAKNGDESEMNFFIDYADCCLKTFFNFKINALYTAAETSGGASDIQKLFFDQASGMEMDDATTEQAHVDLSTFLLIDVSIQTFMQFKRRFSENNAIIAKIEQFLDTFLTNTLLIQCNLHEFSSIKAYLQQKGFETIVAKYENSLDLNELYGNFVHAIDSVEFNELKIKNVLCLMHRVFESSSRVDTRLLTTLLELCKQQKGVELVLSDSVLRNNSFNSTHTIEFLINLADIDEAITSKSVFDEYLNKFLDDLQNNQDDERLQLALKFISKLKNLNAAFLLSLNDHKKIYTNESYVEILLKNRHVIINNDNLRLFEQSFKNLLKCLLKYSEGDVDLSGRFNLEQLDAFLCDCLTFKRNLCNYLARKFVRKSSFMQYLGKFLKNFVHAIQNSVELDATTSAVDHMEVDGGGFSVEYGLTLSRKDQQMLQNQFKVTQSLNFLRFTQSIAGDDDESRKNLNVEVKLSDFISEKINTEMLEKSILNFPVTRKLADVLTHAEITSVNDDVYDPVYVLANFFSLLYYGNVVDVSQFTQTRCLSYVFAALGSKCDRIRSLAYGCLFRFNSHLENSKFYCRNFLSYLIKLLRNSIEKENQRLSFVVSLFLAQLVPVLMEPGSPLYKQIVSFLLLKPTLDLTNVAEFYKFFNSSSLEHKNERKWMLNILRYGVKTNLDFRLYEKRFIYRQLLAIYDSKFSDYEMKIDILELLKTTCEIKPALVDLIKRHYLIIWLTNAIIKLEQEQGENLFQQQNSNNKNLSLFYKLCEIYLLVWLQISEPPALFLTQMFSLLKIILQIFDRITVTEVTVDSGLVKEKFFEVVEHVLAQTRKINETQSDILNTYTLTEIDLNRLFRLQTRKLFEKSYEDYFRIVIGLMQSKRYLTVLSKRFIMENTKFILNVVSSSRKNEFNEETLRLVLTSLGNLLSHFMSDSDFNEDSFHEISINIVEFLVNYENFNHIVSFSHFYGIFQQFLRKQKESNEEITIYDENEKRFLNENCYSIVLA